mmetsp:Transcript_106990/g.300970  ORF Transcript_106990/g.300970 Transcript_106990/m.300970 type:complete len:278 (-) Transcript_106990:2-835(-)
MRGPIVAGSGASSRCRARESCMKLPSPTASWEATNFASSLSRDKMIPLLAKNSSYSLRLSSPATNMRVAVCPTSRDSSWGPCDCLCWASGLSLETLLVGTTGLSLKGPLACPFAISRFLATKGSAEMSVLTFGAANVGPGTGAPQLSEMMAEAWSTKLLGLPASVMVSPELSCSARWNCAKLRRPDVASTDDRSREAAGDRRMPCNSASASSNPRMGNSPCIASLKSSCTGGVSSSTPPAPLGLAREKRRSKEFPPCAMATGLGAESRRKRNRGQAS